MGNQPTAPLNKLATAPPPPTSPADFFLPCGCAADDQPPSPGYTFYPSWKRLPPGYCQDEWVDRIEMSEGSNNDRQVLGVLQRKYNMPEDQLVQLAEKNALHPVPWDQLQSRVFCVAPLSQNKEKICKSLKATNVNLRKTLELNQWTMQQFESMKTHNGALGQLVLYPCGAREAFGVRWYPDSIVDGQVLDLNGGTDVCFANVVW